MVLGNAAAVLDTTYTISSASSEPPMLSIISVKTNFIPEMYLS